MRPYMNRAEIIKYLSISRPTLNRFIRGVESEIPVRYPPEVIAGRWINIYAVLDYMANEDKLKDKFLRKGVREFDPATLAKLCGGEEEECSL